MDVKEQLQRADWPDRITALAEKVVEHDNWEWYLSEQPSWLAERIDGELEQRVTGAKLRGLRRRMLNEGIIEE